MSDLDLDDEPQCCNDFRHGPAVGERTVSVKPIAVDEDGYSWEVHHLCAMCLEETA